MHFKSLLHVRDHSKAKGRAHHLLENIAQHVNMHTGEAFDLSVERLADRLDVTPQWVRQLRTRLVETGELIVKQSRGRHCNVYVIPYERCPACQGGNPKLEFPVDSIPDDSNPQVDIPQPETQPETPPVPTRNSDPANPKLGEAFKGLLERIEVRKEFKDIKEKKEGATRKSIEGWLDKPERLSPYWCEVHDFCHSERLPDQLPGCVRERDGATSRRN
jgi:hypothetical protein